MKIQLDPTGIRWRVSEQQLLSLMAGQTLSIAIAGHALGLHCELSQQNCEHATLHVAQNHWHLILPTMALQAFIKRLPCRDGLELQAQGANGVTPICFEVDVRDSVRSGRRRQLLDPIVERE